MEKINKSVYFLFIAIILIILCKLSIAETNFLQKEDDSIFVGKVIYPDWMKKEKIDKAIIEEKPKLITKTLTFKIEKNPSIKNSSLKSIYKKSYEKTEKETIVTILDTKKFQDKKPKEEEKKENTKTKQIKPSASFDFKISADTEMFASSFLNTKQGKEKEFAEIRFLPSVSCNYNNFNFTVKGDLRLDSQNYAKQIVNNINESIDLWSVNIREAYVSYFGNIIKTKIGKQLIDWSHVDTVAISDFGPRDYTDATRWERIAIPAINIKAEFNNAFFEGFYSPYFTPSKMPNKESRISQSTGDLLIDNNKLDENYRQFGIQTGLYLQDLNIFFNFFDGNNPTPYYDLTFKTDNNPILSSKYVPQKKYSITLEKEINGFMGRTEIGHIDQKGEENYDQITLAIDKQWYGVISDLDNFFLLLQYTKSKEKMKKYNVGRVFDNTITAKAEYQANPTTKINLNAVYDLDDQGSYLNPSIIKQITQNTEMEVGADFIKGSPQFIAEKNEKRVYLKFSINF